ncbi:30S ribosomal protein S6 [bacterium]|nr:30S ribosomal protein S6 [bacterium]
MRKYDTTFIIDGTFDQTQREALIGKFEASLKKLGAEIIRIVRWGQRELAYVVKKRTHGYYVIFYYSADPSMIKPFENELKLNESILRFMTLVTDGKHPDYIRDETIAPASGTVAAESVAIAEDEIELPEELPEEETDTIDELSDDEAIDGDDENDESGEEALDGDSDSDDNEPDENDDADDTKEVE